MEKQQLSWYMRLLARFHIKVSTLAVKVVTANIERHRKDYQLQESEKMQKRLDKIVKEQKQIRSLLPEG